MRLLAVLAILGVCTGVLTGCGPSGDGAGGAQTTVNINITPEAPAPTETK